MIVHFAQIVIKKLLICILLFYLSAIKTEKRSNN